MASSNPTFDLFNVFYRWIQSPTQSQSDAIQQVVLQCSDADLDMYLRHSDDQLGDMYAHLARQRLNPMVHQQVCQVSRRHIIETIQFRNQQPR